MFLLLQVRSDGQRLGLTIHLLESLLVASLHRPYLGNIFEYNKFMKLNNF